MVLSGSSYSCNLPLASHHGKKSKKKKEEVLYLPPLIVTASEKLIKMHARRRQLPQHEIPHAGFSLIELTACFLLIAAAFVCTLASIPSVVMPGRAAAMEEATNNKMKKFNQHRDDWQHRPLSLWCHRRADRGLHHPYV